MEMTDAEFNRLKRKYKKEQEERVRTSVPLLCQSRKKPSSKAVFFLWEENEPAPLGMVKYIIIYSSNDGVKHKSVLANQEEYISDIAVQFERDNPGIKVVTYYENPI